MSAALKICPQQTVPPHPTPIAANDNTRTKVGGRVLNMTYSATNRLISHTDTGGPARSLSYDTHGNVTWLGAQRFKYNMSDQPYQLLGTVTGDYVYDGNLKRVKSVVAGKTIYNVYDASGTLVHVEELNDHKKTDYIGKIARVSRDTITGVDTPIWQHMDHLGSSQTMTSANGTVLCREQYTPFGETLTNPYCNKDQAGFTGHIKDSATGLNYMQARYYDPLIGRFLSIDPVGFSVGSPQMFNRFSYCYNDPINCTDPDGEWGVVGFVYGGIAGAVGGYIASGGTLKGTLLGAGAGAVVGLVAPQASHLAAAGLITATTAQTAVVTLTVAGATAAAASAVGQVGGGVSDGQSLSEAVSNIDPLTTVGAALGGAGGSALATTTARVIVPKILAPIVDGAITGAGELTGNYVSSKVDEAIETMDPVIEPIGDPAGEFPCNC